MLRITDADQSITHELCQEGIAALHTYPLGRGYGTGT